MISEEIDFYIFLENHTLELEKRGYDREQIVAIDFSSNEVIFYMTDGNEITINNPPVSIDGGSILRGLQSGKNI